MALYLVGETIDKTRSHYLAETGKLLQLMRGIYVDAGDDADQVVMAHAVRIARYLYPRAYLSAASAVLLGPTRDGRLYLSGSRVQRTRIRGLEIVQNRASDRPSVASAVVADSLGEFPVSVSAPRQRILEAFRQRSEHAASIDTGMRETIAARLIEEYGDARGAADAVWALAKENDWYKEGEGAEKYLLRRPGPGTGEPLRNEAAFALQVAWHKLLIGQLSHDGFEWRWTNTVREPKLPSLVRQITPGRLPPFIVSLLPEGWLEHVLKETDERTVLREGKRYMSNITISERTEELEALPADSISTRLAAFAGEGVFTGTYAGPGRGAFGQDFEQRLARLYQSADMPRLSGVQIKAPMHLDTNGVLAPATAGPFTHILKPAGTSGFEALPVVEWIGLGLARAVGFETPDHALVPMPGTLPPALLVERFDIRDQDGDVRLIAMEDMCSVLGLGPEDKYTGTIERIARALRPLSTDPESDLRTLMQRALFAWLIADGDMHLKNMALLKIAREGEENFQSVRMAPVYDTVTTRVFPNLAHDRMALKLNGKDERLRRADFVALATLAGLRAGDANENIDRMLNQFGTALDALAVPRIALAIAQTAETAQRTLALCRERLDAFS
ncbi:type II toxin-antitoxin system HipA family toxin [Variovorax sp. RHLX14]|uniref:type II toxin-antitoxin system HipA family toxin n=1 Tax=Variovorax sp. RHLX14 TaxID=1259731 RepID=UPI003F4806ED